MPRTKKTATNPHGLTPKQELTIKEVVNQVRKGEKMDIKKATEKWYNASTEGMVSTMAYRNLAKPNYRAALMERLEELAIIGPNGKVEKRLYEGLDAVANGEVDFNNRLKYIQEIHKIVGAYAPTKIESKSMNLNVDLTQEELDEKIKELNEELEY